MHFPTTPKLALIAAGFLVLSRSKTLRKLAGHALNAVDKQLNSEAVLALRNEAKGT